MFRYLQVGHKYAFLKYTESNLILWFYVVTPRETFTIFLSVQSLASLPGVGVCRITISFCWLENPLKFSTVISPAGQHVSGDKTTQRNVNASGCPRQPQKLISYPFTFCVKLHPEITFMDTSFSFRNSDLMSSVGLLIHTKQQKQQQVKPDLSLFLYELSQFQFLLITFCCHTGLSLQVRH